jgi:hypothetical protein
MASPQQQAKEKEAQKKAVVAAATTVGGAALLAAGFTVTGPLALGAGAVLGYRWLKYRIDNGMRFT